MRTVIRRLAWWVVLPLAIAAYTAAWLTPATWWYRPGRIVITDTVAGADPIVSIQRTIRRDFDGRYAVSLWRNPPDGHVACAGSDTLRYRGGLYEPHEAPLTQWADDPWCARLPPGQYHAEACWTVLRPFKGIVPDKTVCTVTPLFRVTEGREAALASHPTAALRTSSAHWFRLFPESSAAIAALRCTSGDTRNITLPE